MSNRQSLSIALLLYSVDCILRKILDKEDDHNKGGEKKTHFYS